MLALQGQQTEHDTTPCPAPCPTPCPGRAAGRVLWRTWMEHYRTLDEHARQPNRLAVRLIEWLIHMPFFFEANTEPHLRKKLDLLWLRQWTYLRCSWRFQAWEWERVAALKALIMIELCAQRAHARRRYEPALARALKKLVHPDGGCPGVNPFRQLQLLRDLADLKACYASCRQWEPQFLSETMSRIPPFIRMMSLGDGALGCFNGGYKGGRQRIKELLDWVSALDNPAEAKKRQIGLHPDQPHSDRPHPGRPHPDRPHPDQPHPDQPREAAGFVRLERSRVVILVDGGAGAVRRAHRSCASFEMSVGRSRLIVNGGTTETWHEHEADVASYSTLTLGGRALERAMRVNYRLEPPPANTTEPDARLTVSHDGYARRLGAACHRQFVLAADGRQLSGRDSITIDRHRSNRRLNRRRRRPIFGCARFHLHPDSALGRPHERTIDIGLESGELWSFHASKPFRVEESLWCGEEGQQLRARQLIIPFVFLGRDFRIEWRFQRQR